MIAVHIAIKSTDRQFRRRYNSTIIYAGRYAHVAVIRGTNIWYTHVSRPASRFPECEF